MGVALAVALLLQPAAADTVIMRNGDRLTGEVVRKAGGELLVRTHYAGPITLDWTQVRDVQLDTPAPVLLEDESVVSVASLTRQEDTLRMELPAARQPMTVPAQQVRMIQPEPWQTGDGGRFSGQVNLAFQDETGNTDSTELDVDATLSYQRRWSEVEVFGLLEYDTNDGERSTDEWNLNTKYTRRFPNTAWYGAAWLRLKHDFFADTRLRSIIGPALGYRLQPDGGGSFSAEAGPIHLHEDFYDQPDQGFWGPGIFVDFTQPLLQDHLEVYLHGMGFSALGDDNKDVWVSWAGFRVPLVAGFVGSIEYEIDHDSRPAVAAKTTDETLRLKLGYEW